MDGPKNIHILLVENEESGLLLEEELNEFCLLNHTKLKVFPDENKLIEYLKSNINNLKDSVHSIIIFNILPPLNKVIEAVRDIKGNPDFCFIPIFVITSSIDSDDIKDVYRAHANSYMVKPDDLKGLLMLLDKFKELWNYAQLP
ncbi:MAG: hypothetical protein ACXVH2_08755 [Methanobacterium sp.]